MKYAEQVIFNEGQQRILLRGPIAQIFLFQIINL
jgi:hypothetical protein